MVSVGNDLDVSPQRYSVDDEPYAIVKRRLE